MPQTVIRNFLAIDVGEVRLGIAKASAIARLAHPLPAVLAEHAWDELEKLCQTENIDAIVVGLPRGLEGQETDQTKFTRDFVRKLQEKMPDTRVYLQDEALTSKQAEKELASSGKSFDKGAIDSLSATYILEDFLRERQDIK